MESENFYEFSDKQDSLEKLIPINDMYKGWFLDYASYVILERSVPLIFDGLTKSFISLAFFKKFALFSYSLSL